jgi:hypothetical protein
MTTQTYQAASWHLIAQARAELAAGDTRQASEKGWGAAAQIVKAIAERRGWEHKTHAALFVAVSRLVNETGDDHIRNLFAVSNSLHTNFYENWDTADNVAGSLDDVERLLNRLDPLLQ